MQSRFWLSIVASALAVSVGRAQENADTGRIEVGMAARGPARPITLAQIVEQREVIAPQLSPDGQFVAFTIRQAFLDRNDYRVALYVAPTDSGAVVHKILETAALSQVHWTQDGQYLTFILDTDGSVHLWRVHRDGGPAEAVFVHQPNRGRSLLRQPESGWNTGDSTGAIQSYAWSPDGRRVAFTSHRAVDSGARAQLEERGVRYDDSSMSIGTIQSESWIDQPDQLWVYDVSTKSETLVWQGPQSIADLAWSPDQQNVAVDYSAPPIQRRSMLYFNRDIGVVSIADGSFSVVADSEASEMSPEWAPDGKSLAFVSHFDELSSIVVVDLAKHQRTEVARGVDFTFGAGLSWAKSGRALWFEAADTNYLRRQGLTGVYSVRVPGGQPRRLALDSVRLSDCTFDLRRTRAACVRQSPTTPPAPVIVDLATENARVVAEPNGALATAVLAPVTEMRWVNRYGAETNGYLVLPPDCKPARRCPLLVMTYAFSGKFTGQAEWITSYPVQPLAAAGFVVLMMNYPPVRTWSGSDFAVGSVVEGYSSLSSMETGIDRLVRMGLVDTARVGVLGWSYGGFLSEFAITHSRTFRVAEVGAGGDYNPGIYWAVGSRDSRRNDERVMGGPPYGATLKNWLSFSPAFNADRVRAPVLMEFSAEEAPFGLEMLTALNRHRVPTEFVMYPRDGHVLSRPRHRYFSMLRNLQWFAFWLLDREMPDPVDPEQYQRWRSMRSSLRAESTAPRLPSAHDERR